MADRMDEELAACAVEYLGEDAGLGQITAWVNLLRAAPDLLAALEKLVAADNCNYEAQTMRNAGYFTQARAAVAKAHGK